MDKIGEGGTGTVFLVFDEHLVLKRVLKMIRPGEGPGREIILGQFIREIHNIRKIRHQAVPRIIDVFTEEDSLMIIMEWIPGKTLEEYVRESGPASEDQVTGWGLQLASILKDLHGRNPPLLHLDLKPANIILHPSGKLYLIDFGAALGGDVHAMGETYLGTPAYAAPEQYTGEILPDIRTDIYGLGRTLTFCLFGKPGIPEDAHLRVSSFFLSFLGRCTAPCPGDRYRDMGDLEAALGLIRGRQERKKAAIGRIKAEYLVWGLGALFCLLLLGRCFVRESRETEALRYVEYAEESVKPDEKLSFYRSALKKAPWKEEIYQSMTDVYILPNHFSSGQAVKLVSLLRENGALSVLRTQNPGAYSRFCYELGMGFFHQMGGIGGRREAGTWFSRALGTGNGLSPEQKEKAACYVLIGEYHQTFLDYGQDESSDGARKSYGEFYRLLKRLCVYYREPGSIREDETSSWYAAFEVAMEIRDYAGHFLEEPEITEEMLLDELKAVDSFASGLAGSHNLERRERLTALVAEAEKAVKILEASDGEENLLYVAGDSSGSVSDGENRSDGGRSIK